jgi:alcohol dehydrogenase/L-iditol 2-dehydrogenase
MKALVQYALAKDAVELRDMPRPQCRADEALVQVKAVSVCGSDLHQKANRQSWPVNIPVILGHEFSGVIVEVGSGVEGFPKGTRVACETSAIICGRCIHCRSGNYQLCSHRKGFGYGTHGAMAEFVAVPERILHSVPENVRFETAALAEPASVAYNAVILRGGVRLGDLVVVLGPGPIGILCVAMAAMSGASSVILAGLASDARRLAEGRKLGATHTVVAGQTEPIGLVRDISGSLGADLVVDATGVSASLKTAMELVRAGGAIVKVGWGPQPMAYSMDPLVQKAADIRASFSHNFPIWEKVIRLLANDQLDLSPLTSRTYPLAAWREAFEDMESGRNLKSILLPGA